MESTPEKNSRRNGDGDSSAKMITVPSRNSYRQTLLKPQAVDLYNNNMNGVDVADQLTVFIHSSGKLGSGGGNFFSEVSQSSLLNSLHALIEILLMSPYADFI